MAKSDFSCVKTRVFLGFCHRAFVLQAQVPNLCTNLDFSLIYILILGTYSKFARNINFPVASRMTSAPSRSDLADRSDLPVMLITRLSKADKKNLQGRSLSICRTGTINIALSTPGFLLALLWELSHFPQGLTENAEAKQVRKMNQTDILYHIRKMVRKINPHVSNL